MYLARLISLLLAVAPVGALACSPAFPIKNLRTSVAADCSFQNAGDIDNFINGNAAVDLGRGRIGQEIFPGSLARELMVADCTTSEVIAITPPDIPGTETSCGFDTDLSVITPPKANYSNRSAMSDIVADARARGLRVNLAIQYINDRFRKRDQFDLFCGCKLFYPDSVEGS